MIKNSLHPDMTGTYKGKQFVITDVAGNEITIKYKDSGKSEVVNKADLEEGTTGWKTNSFKMPFDLAPARQARGQSLYGSEVKNATDANGKHINIGDTVLIIGGGYNEDHEVKAISGGKVVLDDGQQMAGEELQLLNEINPDVILTPEMKKFLDESEGKDLIVVASEFKKKFNLDERTASKLMGKWMLSSKKNSVKINIKPVITNAYDAKLGMEINKFNTEVSAKSFSGKTTKVSRIFMGDDGLFWVVGMADGEKLIKGGYEEVSK